MAEIGSAFLSILPSARGFGSRLESEVGGETKGAGKKIGASFGKVFGVAAGAVAAVGVADFLGGAIADARESAKITALTENVIKTTGSAANVTAKQVQDLAGSIAAKTGIDDAAIQSASNLLLTFTSLRNEVGKGNDIFNQATKIATDMGAALGTEPKAAAIQLGKALNDPIKGVGALSRVGVSFTEQQKKVIKSLTDSGDIAGAQKIILKELGKEFGGSAEAQATAADKAAFAFGELKESIGTALLPAVEGISKAFIKALPSITAFTEGAIAKARPLIADFGDIVQTRILPALKSFGGFLTGQVIPAAISFGNTLRKYQNILVPIAAGIGAIVVALKLYKLYITIVAAATRAYAAIQAALNVVLSANPIGLLVLAIAGLATGLVVAYKKSETFRGIVDNIFAALKKFAGFVTGKVLPVVLKIGSTFLKMAKFGIDAFTFLLDAAFTTFEGILAAADKGLGWIPGLGGKISSARKAFSGFKDSTIGALRTVSDKVGAASKALDELAKPRTAKFTTVYVERYVSNRRARDEAQGAGASGRTIAGVNLGRAGRNSAAAFRKTAEEIAEQLTKAFKKVGKKGKEAISGLRDQLAGLRDQFHSLATSVGDAFKVDLFSGGLADLFSNGTQNVASLKAVTAALAKLKGIKGISKGFLTALFQSGNSSLITQLAGSDAATVRNAQSLFNQQNSLASTLGSNVAANQLGKDLEHLGDRIDKRLEQLIRATQNAPKEVGKTINGAAVNGRRNARAA